MSIISGASAGATIGSAVPGIGTVVGGALGGAVDFITGLFGGKKDPPGEWKDGLFLPGDWNNRVAFANQQAAAYGVQNLIDNQRLDSLLRGGNWQGLIPQYFQQLADSKKVPTQNLNNQMTNLASSIGIPPLVFYALGGGLIIYLLKGKK